MKELPIHWLELKQSVEDAEVPALQQYIHTGIKYEVVSTLPCMLLLLFGQWLHSPLIWERVLPFYGLMTVTTLIWYFWVHSHKLRDPTIFHTIHVGLVLFTLSMQGWFHVNGYHPLPNGAFTALAINVVACPMSMKRYIPLGIITIAAECLGSALAGGGIEEFILKILAGTVTLFYVLLGVRIIRVLLKTRDQSQKQLIAAERLSTLGHHTASIAHELKTPLASAHQGVYTLEQLHKELQESIGHPDVNEDDLREIGHELQNHLSTVKDGLERSTQFVNALREHTQQMHQHQTVEFSPQERLEVVSNLLNNIYGSRVALHILPFHENITLTGDIGKFDQLIINLVNNAVESCVQAQISNSEVAVMPRLTHKTFTITVQDNGIGVPNHLKERIFAPMFTTKGSSGGTGLGLAMCRDIVEGVFGGSLALLDSTIGARFVLTFPLHKRSRPARSNSASFSPFPQADQPQTLH